MAACDDNDSTIFASNHHLASVCSFGSHLIQRLLVILLICKEAGNGRIVEFTIWNGDEKHIGKILNSAGDCFNQIIYYIQMRSRNRSIETQIIKQVNNKWFEVWLCSETIHSRNSSLATIANFRLEQCSAFFCFPHYKPVEFVRGAERN